MLNGQLREGISELETAVTLSPRARFAGSLANAYAASGRTAEARTILEKLRELGRHQYVSPTAIAHIYVGLADKRSALAWLKKAYQAHDFELVAPDLVVLDAKGGRVDIRSDPYYHEIFAGMGLPR